MKKTVLVALWGLFSVSSLWAAGITLTTSANYYDFDADRSVVGDVAADPESYQDSGVYSLGIGYRWDNAWQAELVYSSGDTGADIDGGSGVLAPVDIDMTQVRLDALYHMSTDGDLRPYWVVGLGENKFEEPTIDRTETVLSYGTGFKHRLNDAAALRYELRAVSSADAEDTDLAFSIGLQFTFLDRSADSE